mgnify:FL=1
MRPRLHSPAFSLLADFDRANAPEAEPDIDAMVKAAYDDGFDKGRAEGRAEAEKDAEQLLLEAAVRHVHDLEQEKQTWQQDCADVLADRLQNVTEQLSRRLEERIAVLLRPWLIDRLRERALSDLEKAISRALAEGAKVHIEAPAEIIARLQDTLPAQSFHIGFSESATADIRAHIEDTDIEVNISAWIADLEAAAHE